MSLVLSPPAQSAPGDWVASNGSAVRLLAAGAAHDGSGDLLGAVEIRLDPGTITYWRTPGDAGVAPTFETGGSGNVAAIRVDFPAPRRLDEAGSEAFGYLDDVVFPIHVKRTDPTQPADLALKLDYAVCAKQCLPASARLTLQLTDQPTPETPDVAAALALVPARAALKAPGAPSVMAVEPAADASAFRVTARADTRAQLFIEAAGEWYFDVGQAERTGDGLVVLPVKIAQKPENGRLAGLPLTLTLVDGTKAVEVHAAAEQVAPGP